MVQKMAEHGLCLYRRGIDERRGAANLVCDAWEIQPTLISSAFRSAGHCVSIRMKNRQTLALADTIQPHAISTGFRIVSH